jgi:hypothetical protein
VAAAAVEVACSRNCAPAAVAADYAAMGLMLCICWPLLLLQLLSNLPAAAPAAATTAYAAMGLMLCICWPLLLLPRKLLAGAALR